jgi:NDP-hexose 4,6-dehydratase
MKELTAGQRRHGHGHSIGQLAAEIARLMGSGAEISEDPRRLRPKDSEVLRLCCDATRLRERTGWQPHFTREQGLQQTTEWFQRPGNLARYNPDEYNQ